MGKHKKELKQKSKEEKQKLKEDKKKELEHLYERLQQMYPKIPSAVLLRCIKMWAMTEQLSEEEKKKINEQIDNVPKFLPPSEFPQEQDEFKCIEIIRGVTPPHDNNLISAERGQDPAEEGE